MKRIVSLLTLLLFVLSLYTPVLAASVPVQNIPGNDTTDYNPSDGYIHYQIPYNEPEGCHPNTFNNDSTVDPDAFQTNQAVIPLTGLQSSLLIINTILQIISTIFLGLLAFFVFLILFGSKFNIFGSCIRRFHRKPHKPNKPTDKDKDCHKKEDKDCDHNKDNDCHKIDDKDCDSKNHNSYCDKKYNPSKGYSLDCDDKNIFPYNNNYNKHI